MLTLSLLRHAKSSWADPSLDDFVRPLNSRGAAAAPMMGHFMAGHGIAPDLILSSGALRTRQTLDLVLPHLDVRPKIKFDDELYLTTAKTMCDRLTKVPAGAAHVMVLGHNPGIQRLALDLAGSGGADDLSALAGKFPTAALALLTFDVAAWRDIKPAGGHLDLFMTPKQLG